MRPLLTFLVAQLLVLGPFASFDLVRVRVDGLVDRLRHFLLPALRYDQREVLVQLLVAVQQLQDTEGSDGGSVSIQRVQTNIRHAPQPGSAHLITLNNFLFHSLQFIETDLVFKSNSPQVFQ